MADYSKSIIYTIRSKDNIYVGSTLNFRSRKNNHKSIIYNENSKAYTYNLYKNIRENNGEWDMQPYSKYPCNSKLELTIEEERVRQLLKADMNMCACSSGLSALEYRKQYREKNKDKIIKQTKQYREQHKVQTYETIKQYRKRYPEKLAQQNKRNYEKSKDKRNQKVTCECGCIIAKCYLTAHKKTKRHLKLLEV